MLIGCGVTVGVAVTVGVCVAVGGLVAVAVGVVEGVGGLAIFVSWTALSPVTGSSCASSVADPEQAAVRMARISKGNQMAGDLRMVRMLDTCKSRGSEIYHDSIFAEMRRF
jgi:hypothetical protein